MLNTLRISAPPSRHLLRLLHLNVEINYRNYIFQSFYHNNFTIRTFLCSSVSSLLLPFSHHPQVAGVNISSRCSISGPAWFLIVWLRRGQGLVFADPSESLYGLILNFLKISDKGLKEILSIHHSFRTCHQPQFSHVNRNLWLWPPSDWLTSTLGPQLLEVVYRNVTGAVLYTVHYGCHR